MLHHHVVTRSLLLALLLASAAIPAARPALAIDSTWNADADGNWSDATKWTAGIPNAVGDIARLTYDITAARTLNITSTVTIGSLYLGDDTSGYTITGGGLTLDVSIGSAFIQSSGTGVKHTIDTSVYLSDPVTVMVTGGELLIHGHVYAGQAGMGITKTGAGTLTFSTVESTYSGPTTIMEGSLAAFDGLVGVPSASNLVLAGGVLEGMAGLKMERTLGTGAGQIQWTASGGFAARNYKADVGIGGLTSPLALTWGVGGFVPHRSALLFGATLADNEVEFKNSIDLAGAVRTIAATDNPATDTDFATLSGVLSNGSLLKDGQGTVVFSATNSYAGATIIAGGPLGAADGKGLPTASNLVLAGGVLESVGVTTFVRALGTASTQVQWTGSGGFSAKGGKMTVAIGGSASPTPLTWGAGGFVPDGGSLIFGSPTADNGTEFRNRIDLAGGIRTVTVVDNPARTTDFATLSAALSNGGLNKGGWGTLVLKGANSYTEPTMISQGALIAIDGASLPAASNLTLAGGVFVPGDTTAFVRGLGAGAGQIQWTGSAGFAAIGNKTTVAIGGTGRPTPLIWGSGGFVPNGASLVFGSLMADSETEFRNTIDLAGAVRTVTVNDNASSNADVATLSGVLSGGGLVKNGSGTLVLKAANSYTGPTTIAAGALVANHGEGLPAASNLVLEGGVLEGVGHASLGRTLGTGGNQVRWTGIGGFSASGGKMTVAIGGAASPSPLAWGAGGFVPSGAVLLFGSSTADSETEFSNDIDLGGVDRTVTVNDNASSAEDFATLSGVLSNGGLVKSGAGRLLLTGVNTYAATTTVSEGTLVVCNGQSLGSSSGGTTVLHGATLEVAASVPNEPIKLGRWPISPGSILATGPSVSIGPVTLSGAGGASVTVPDGCSLTMTAGVTGASAVQKRGLGTLVLAGSIAPGGVIDTLEGTVVIAPGATLTHQLQLNVQEGGAIEIRTPAPTNLASLTGSGVGGNGALRVVGTSFDYDGLVVLGSSKVSIYVSESRTLSVSGVVERGGLSKIGLGTLAFTAANTYTGVTSVVSGAFRAIDGVSLPVSSTLGLGGGVLEGIGNTTFTRGLGGVTFGTGGGGFSAYGGKMTVAIGGTTTPTPLWWGTGYFVPAGSALLFGSATADHEVEFRNSIDLAGAARTVTVNDNPFSAGDFATLSGTLSNGSLTKDGVGLLVLKGSHTYTGATTVAAGTLKLATGAVLASTTFDVGSGAALDLRDLVGGLTLGAGKSLKGGGTVLGDLVVGGTLSPGESPGILSVEDITFAAGSILNMELGGTVRGGGYDALVSSGDVVLQNGSTLSVSLISSFVPQVGDEFDVLDFSSLSGQFTTINLPVLAGGLSWSTDDLYLDGTIGITPEPATLALLALGGLGMLLRRRRK